jgi:hypothetical protein
MPCTLLILLSSLGGVYASTGRVFVSPTTFATSCRGRTVSGWREVRYKGISLDHYRTQFCERFNAEHLVAPNHLEVTPPPLS